MHISHQCTKTILRVTTTGGLNSEWAPHLWRTQVKAGQQSGADVLKEISTLDGGGWGGGGQSSSSKVLTSTGNSMA